MITIKQFTFNDFQENTYVLYDETKECTIIDPGCYKASEQMELYHFIQQNQLQPVKLLNTHCHIDHVLGNAFVALKFKLALYMHEDELFTYNSTSSWASIFGITMEQIPEERVYITEGDTINFGNSSLQILLTPGHSVASLCFYHMDERICISGDVLFAGSIGRTDLPGGNSETLLKSIHEKLMLWPDDMKIYPGHGPATTIGWERKTNPYIIR